MSLYLYLDGARDFSNEIRRGLQKIRRSYFPKLYLRKKTGIRFRESPPPVKGDHASRNLPSVLSLQGTTEYVPNNFLSRRAICRTVEIVRIRSTQVLYCNCNFATVVGAACCETNFLTNFTLDDGVGAMMHGCSSLRIFRCDSALNLRGLELIRIDMFFDGTFTFRDTGI